MDITPVYELRSRLRTAAIAGTNLLAEDFRLKRAVEAMQPLAAASPVFAKIVQLSEKLLSSTEPDKEGTLLDVITLVDALLCTQGVVNVAGDIEPIQVDSCGSVVTNAPYSVVKTLIEALTTSGNGHYNHVCEMREKQPEVFADYRVKAAMVEALGASYAELAELVTKWLKQEGESIVPLLQAGFDPKGKKEMVRRVQVMDAVAGGKANAFYLAQIPEAEKEVRRSLVYALRHCVENVDVLIDMTKSEKGSSKKAAYYALSCMEHEKAAEFFEKLMAKKPKEALAYLEISRTEWASAMIAKGLQEKLEPWLAHRALTEKKELTAEEAMLLELYLKALPYKSGAEIRECYRMAASIGTRLDKPVEGGKADWTMRGFLGVSYPSVMFSSAIANLLKEAVMLHPEEELFALALELYEKAKDSEGEVDYFQTAFTAKLLAEEDNCAWLREQMYKRSLFGQKKKTSVIACMEQVLKKMFWDNQSQAHVLHTSETCPADEQHSWIIRPIKQKLPGAFTELLMEIGSTEIDERLSCCINPQDIEYRDMLLSYFYKRALVVSENRIYCIRLKNHGWTRCEGLAVHYFKSRSSFSMWEMISYVSQMPGSREDKQAEMRKVIDLLKSGKIKGRDMDYERLEQYIQEL